MNDRFKRELVDGDFIMYIENGGDKPCFAYVSLLPGQLIPRFARCYSEEWAVPGEAMICPCDIQLWMTREVHTLQELNINPWTIIALRNVDTRTLSYGKVW